MADHIEPGFYPAGDAIITKIKRAQSVRFRDDEILQPLYEREGAPDGEDTEKANDSGEVVPYKNWEQIRDKVEELAEKVAIHFEDENKNEIRRPFIVKAPLQPTRDEIERHQTIHTPYAEWCKHCVAARVVRRQHRHRGKGAIVILDVDSDVKGPIKVSLDYMYLHERMGKGMEVAYNPLHLVMIEHRYGRCWVCQIRSKGVHDKANWLSRRIIQDLDNNGLKDAKIQLKSDQEPAIANLQTEIEELRSGMVIPTNSPVGESQCNGREENTTRRI